MERFAGRGSFELVRGEVIELPPGMPKHGRICIKIALLLEMFGQDQNHGYTLGNDSAVVTRRSPDSVRGADVAYYSPARLPDADLDDRLAPVVPDLVVEVLSPSNRPGEMRDKVAEYLAAGVLMVWIVDPPRRTLAVHRAGLPAPPVFGEAEVVEGLPELPGFRCVVGEMFP